MTARVLEAVPNFSEGRDLTVVRAIVDAMRPSGAEVLDWSADPDHNRSVVTVIGTPAQVEDAAFAGAAVAVERIDLRRHSGVHPRIGAIDVLPFVPLAGLSMEEVTESARRVGDRLAAELALPVFFYGYASDPPGQNLAALRRGGFESLSEGWPDGRKADLLPEHWPYAGGHPTAGACCVGSRSVLLAWNIWVSNLSSAEARSVARAIRQTNGGIAGVRALALELPSRNALQISMNLEDVQNASPGDVFRRVSELVEALGGDVEKTEVIGMIPDQLVTSASPEELKLENFSLDRLLSRRLANHVAKQGDHLQA
jgi:glutamate formiminotransferase